MSTVKGTLLHGIRVGEDIHRDFEVREALVDDMVQAEKDVSPTELHAFNVQLLSRVTVRVGNFTGPYTPGMFMKLKRGDYNALVQAMLEADKLGESAPAAAGNT